MSTTTTKCEVCGIGRTHLVTLPYMRPLGRRMMVLPNAPAARCDVCGDVTFDPYFVQVLDQMLRQLARERQSKKRQQQRLAERQPSLPTARRSG